MKNYHLRASKRTNQVHLPVRSNLFGIYRYRIKMYCREEPTLLYFFIQQRGEGKNVKILLFAYPNNHFQDQGRQLHQEP